MPSLLSDPRDLIDAKNAQRLADFLGANENNPELDLNHVTDTGLSALWWALHPKQGAVSSDVLNVLISTGKISPHQACYGIQPHQFHWLYKNLGDEIIDHLSDWEATYVAEEQGPARDVNDIALHPQGAHDLQSIFQTLMLDEIQTHWKTKLADFEPWVCNLPKNLREAYFETLYADIQTPPEGHAFHFAQKHNRWAHFPFRDVT